MKAIATKYYYQSLKDHGADSETLEKIEQSFLKQEFINDVIGAMNQGSQVVEMIDINQVGGGAAVANSILNKPPREFFIEKYEALLAHEIGHALGLTHNFKASYDESHFYFEDEHKNHGRKARRSGSSVFFGDGLFASGCLGGERSWALRCS